MIKHYRYFLGFIAAAHCQLSLASLEEITITAQKREQTLIEIPFSASAFNADSLAARNIDRISDLSNATPGLFISDSSPNFVIYSIRGIGSHEPSAQGAARVAIYLNDVDISRNRSSHIELYDMNRVEIIKGPQATLFGTTASSGAIAYYTNKPQQEEAGAISISRGNYDSTEIQGYMTGGNDTVQWRIAGLAKERDGYIQNSRPFTELGSRDRFSIRPSLQWLINPQWQANLVLSHEEADDSVSPNKSGLIAPANGNTSPYSNASLSGNIASSPTYPLKGFQTERSTDDINLQLEGTHGDWGIRLISGYREYDVTVPFDGDGSQAWAFELLEQSSGHQFSQELQINLTKERMSLLGGLSYFNEKTQRTNGFSADEGSYLMCIPTARNVIAPLFQLAALANPSLQPLANIINPISGLPCANADGSINSLSPFATGGLAATIPYYASLTDYGDNESFSAYVDTSINLSETLTINAGFRYITEDRSSGFSAYSPTAVLLQNQLPLLTLGDTAGQIIYSGNNESDLLFRLNAQYQWADKHYAYISYSEGRRSAVSDLTTSLDASFQSVINLNQIPPEELESYEIGIKGKTQSLQYAAAIYQQSYTNFQISFINGSGQFVTQNAGSTKNVGAEFDLTWQASDTVQLFSSMAVIDNKFENKASNGLFAGKKLVHTPETSASVGINFDTAFNDTLNVFVNLYANYRSEVALDAQRQPIDPVSGLSLMQESVTLMNGNIGFYAKDAWKLQLWVDNLTDEAYLLDASSIGANIGTPTYAAAPPMTWGLKFGLAF